MNDFKVGSLDGQDYLTMVSLQVPHLQGSEKGACSVLNSSYHVVELFRPPLANTQQDMHEFTLLNQSRTALMLSSRIRPDPANETEKALDNIFVELDIDTKQIVFDWASLDHVPVAATIADGDQRK